MLQTVWRAIWVLALILSATAAGHAQSSGKSVMEAMKPALEQAEKSGATVIVVSPGEKKQTASGLADPAGMADRLMRAKFRLGLVLKGHREAWANMKETLAKASPNGRPNWLFEAIIAGIVSVVIGRLLTKPIVVWGRNNLAPRVDADPENRSQRIGRTLFRGMIFLIMAAISAAIGTLLVVFYAGDHVATRTTGLAIVWTYAAFRFMRSIYINLLMVDRPVLRSIYMNNEDAQGLYRALMAGTAVSVTIIGLCIWMDALGLNRDTHKLALMMGSLTAALLLSTVAVVYRQSIARAILGPGDAMEKPFWRRTLARTWHIVAVIYLGSAWLVSSVRLLLDESRTGGLVAAPLLALIGCLAIYGLLLVLIDAYFDKDLPARDETAASEDEAAQVVDEVELANEAVAQGSEPAPMPEPIELRTGRSIFKGLAEHAAALIVTIAGFVYVARVWNVDLSDQTNWVTDSLEIAIVMFIAYIAYQAVEIWVKAKREEEGDVESSEPGDDPGGHGASRLVTLLPIFRNFLLITIVIISGMIVLSEIGVDIGPLFAGAGVVGLAIGFGAQTLIRDIFSGAFFLIDDAFRKGEYIDIGTAKGTVEKISIRSFQLRHHRGALNTVPFGEIRQLTNYSRDWVMMKLPIRLTYDTDLEKVRKLVKKLGQELLDDPELGPKFLQPLKSQGAAQLEDSAMIVRLKFMTKPGDQWVIRKRVYAEIRAIFEREGIKFAHREVTVRVNDGSTGADAARIAAAGAAVATAEAGQPQPLPDKP
jgi:small-conductance mechanosensitive channel